MFIVTIMIFALPFLLATALSYHPALGVFRNSALNPLLLFAGYVFLACGDYVSMMLLGEGQLARHVVSIDGFKLGVLQLKSAFMMLAFLVGIATIFQASPRALPSPGDGQRAPTFKNIAVGLYLAILGGWFFSVWSLGINIESLADTVSVKSAAIWAAPLFALSLLLVPALAYALVKQPFRVAVPLVLISIAVLMLSGSRTRILFVLIPFAFYLYRVRAVRLPRLYFLVAVLVFGTAAVAAVNFRTMVGQGNRITIENVLDTSNIFQLNDLSFAETSVALSRIPRNALSAYPGEDLVGFVLAPIPRSVASIKPDPGSRQFTAIFDPFQFTKYQRGLTIGGINEITYDYPFYLALVVVYGLGAAFAAGFLKASRSRSIHGFVWTVGSYAMFYVFLKQDLQATGQLFWVFAFYSLVMIAVQKAKAPIARAPRRPPPRRISQSDPAGPRGLAAR